MGSIRRSDIRAGRPSKWKLCFPELVGHDEDGKPNSVDMMGVLPRAVNAIQAEEYEIIGLASSA